MSVRPFVEPIGQVYAHEKWKTESGSSSMTTFSLASPSFTLSSLQGLVFLTFFHLSSDPPLARPPNDDASPNEADENDDRFGGRCLGSSDGGRLLAPKDRGSLDEDAKEDGEKEKEGEEEKEKGVGAKP